MKSDPRRAERGVQLTTPHQIGLSHHAAIRTGQTHREGGKNRLARAGEGGARKIDQKRCRGAEGGVVENAIQKVAVDDRQWPGKRAGCAAIRSGGDGTERAAAAQNEERIEE